MDLQPGALVGWTAPVGQVDRQLMNRPSFYIVSREEQVAPVADTVLMLVIGLGPQEQLVSADSGSVGRWYVVLGPYGPGYAWQDWLVQL